MSFVLVSVLAFLPASPTAVSAQGSPDFEAGPGDAVLLGSNALVGGLTAGVWRWVRGGAFRDGFVPGLVGGALGFAGKRVAVEHWDGAGLLGRQLSSVGGSVVRNASDGREAIGRLVFSVGPVRIYWEREGEQNVRVRMDLPTVAAAVYVLATDGGLDAGASLSSGALVFSRLPERGEDMAPGRAVGATILLEENPFLTRAEREAVFAHERVHVLQHDQAQLSWGEPLDAWLLDRFGGSPEGRWVDLGAIGAVGIGMKELVWPEPPWEAEADGLDGLDGPVSGGGGRIIFPDSGGEPR